MVLKKSMHHGFNGYQIPFVPRAPRSIRKRGSRKTVVEDSQVCAIEMLATIARNILLERESLSTSNNAVAQKDNLSITTESIKQERKYENESPIRTVSQQPSSATITFDSPKKVHHNVNSVVFQSKTAFGSFPSNVDECSPSSGKMGSEIEIEIGAEGEENGNARNKSIAKELCSKDPIDMCMKVPTLTSSDSSVELLMCGDTVPNASFVWHGNNVKVVSRDDDEKSSGCNRPSTDLKPFGPPCRVVDRRIRKFLTSKYWKVAPKLKDCEYSNYDMDIKPIHRNRKSCYSHQRSYREGHFKRRKVFDQRSLVTSDGVISSESVTNSPEKEINRGKSCSGVSGASSTVSHQVSSRSEGSHVKLRIKSFKVPELFIDVPESATVGSLKSTVMDAVTSLLGGGLCVGILLQGKKLRDDNRTLLQTGISHDHKIDTLGFTLDPIPAQNSPTLCPEDPSFLLPCHSPQSLTRSPATPKFDAGFSDASPDSSPHADLGKFVDNKHDTIPSSTNTLTDKAIADSRALVAVPEASIETLAMVPANHKTKPSELAQRRTRRPFSVSEVEALVEAVENLGTGRWRDVKLRAFDCANHRTYVDLKDKWKTLVHTARISPQQRRGQPVPQELLDRVLAAHAYWSHHQAKQQTKLEPGTPKIGDP